jgi:hypothetical protein
MRELRTLYSSESLVNFDSICPSWRGVSQVTPDRADECTFCCRSLSSPRPEKSVRKSAMMLSTICRKWASARAAPNEYHTSHEEAEVLVLSETHRTFVDELHLVLAVPRPSCRDRQSVYLRGSMRKVTVEDVLERQVAVHSEALSNRLDAVRAEGAWLMDEHNSVKSGRSTNPQYRCMRPAVQV